jgi:HemY protein
MSNLLKIWLALLAGAAMAAVVYRDSGYVLLSYDVWSVEMSLALLVLLVAALFTALYLLLRLLAGARRLPADTRAWRHRRGARLARRTLTRGLLELSEGNWPSAEKNLVKHADRSETPLLNYLAAARAAQLQGAHERRDSYIRLAHESMPSADVAVSLTQAELQLADHQLEQALATLRHLRSIAPRHTYVLRLLRRLYEQLGDWDQLRELLPELRKRKVIPAEEQRELEVRVHRALLERASLSVEKTRVREIWEQLPRGLKQDHRLVGDYAHYLQERGKDDEAEALVRDTLKQHWEPGLVELYGLLDTAKPARQLALAESLLQQHPQDPTLLLTLGRLCLRAKLWGKARGYLEASIGAGGAPAAFRELGHLLEQMGEAEAALALYRRGLAGAGGPEPVPLPDHIGPARSNQPLLHDEPQIQAPAPHGARPVTGST